MASASYTGSVRASTPSTKTVRASVIVSTYNGDRYLKTTLECLLHQTFSDFELIVVDDGSTDNTQSVLANIKDPRLVVLRHSKNLGVAASLNEALKLARSEYVFLQDHDDLSTRDRLERQIGYLEKHPSLVVLGSSGLIIDESGQQIGKWTVPLSDIDLKWTLLSRNPFLHTSIAMRRPVLESFLYSTDSRFRFAEDYEWLSRVAEKHPVANISEPLVKWRSHRTQASSQNEEIQKQSCATIAVRNMESLLGVSIEPALWISLRELLLASPREEVHVDKDDVQSVAKLMRTLATRFYRKYNFSPTVSTEHRKAVYWMIGRHFLALAYRRDKRRNLACRSALLTAGARFVFSPLISSARQSS